jgi:hypothetical protein
MSAADAAGGGSAGGRDARLQRIIGAVCAAAVADSGAAGVLVLEAATPEGALLCRWLDAGPGTVRVWRGDARSGNVQGDAAARDALVAHPANKTALLLGGRLPAVDLLPLGDLWASEAAELAGAWSAPAAVTDLAAAAGGVAALDAALRRLVDERRAVDDALGSLGDDVAARLLQMYERGRWFRLRSRLTPKLSARTLGIDLFD